MPIPTLPPAAVVQLTRPGAGPAPGPRPGTLPLAGVPVGQLLAGRVLEIRPDGRAVLDIAGVRLESRAPVPFSAGEQLTLRMEGAAPAVTLAVVARLAADRALAVRALGADLARELPLRAVLDALLASPARTGGTDPAGPEVTRVIAALLERLPRRTGVSDPAGLRRALLESGVMLESRLRALAAGTGGERLGFDLKAELLRLRAALERTEPARRPGSRPGPPLTELVEGALARIRIAQALGALAPEPGAGRTLSAELPVVGPGPFAGPALSEPVSLRVEGPEDGGTGEGGTEPGGTWAVRLELELPGLGRLEASLRLDAAGRVGATLWASEPETAALVRAHLDRLQEGLRRRGLEVGALSCEHGPRPATAPHPLARPLLHVVA